MKKSRFFIIFALPLMLSSCEKIMGGDVTFKDNLEFKKELSNTEIALVEAKASHALYENCSQVNTDMTIAYNYVNKEAKSTAKMTANFYSNLYLSSVTETTEYEKANGVGLTNTYKEYKEAFDAPELNAIVTVNQIEGRNSTFSKSTYTDETALDARSNFRKTYLDQMGFFSLPSDIKAYQTDDGKYMFVSSEIEETITEVTYLDKKVEHITRTKAQIILEIGTDYHVTGYTYYREQATNRDPESNTWYSEIKTVGLLKMRLSFTYGVLSQASQDTINNAKAKIDGNYMLPANLTVTIGTYNATNKTYIENSSSTVTYETTRLGLSKYRYEARFTLPKGTDTNNAFRVKLSGNVYDKWNSTTYTSKIKDLQLANFIAVTTTSGIAVNIIPTGKVYQVILMFEVAAVNGDVSVNMITQEAFEK